MALDGTLAARGKTKGPKIIFLVIQANGINNASLDGLKLAVSVTFGFEQFQSISDRESVAIPFGFKPCQNVNGGEPMFIAPNSTFDALRGPEDVVHAHITTWKVFIALSVGIADFKARLEQRIGAVDIVLISSKAMRDALELEVCTPLGIKLVQNNMGGDPKVTPFGLKLFQNLIGSDQFLKFIHNELDPLRGPEGVGHL